MLSFDASFGPVDHGLYRVLRRVTCPSGCSPRQIRRSKARQLCIVESVSHLKQCWLDDGAWVTVHVWQWDPQLDEIRNLETVGTGEHVLSVLLTNRWSAPHYSLLVDK